MEKLYYSDNITDCINWLYSPYFWCQEESSSIFGRIPNFNYALNYELKNQKSYAG